jgi:orotate phosphoribosyltransferase
MDHDPGAAGELARRLHRACHLTGTFTLRSGVTSDEYFDKFLFESDPALLHDVAVALAPLLWDGTEAIAGLELGGVPIATVLSQVTGLPARYVRKEPKAYGTARLAEGGPVDGVALTIVEDVVTRAGQIIDSARRLRAEGARLLGAVCVVDREAGGAEALADEGIELRALFTMADLRPE